MSAYLDKPDLFKQFHAPVCRWQSQLIAPHFLSFASVSGGVQTYHARGHTSQFSLKNNTLCNYLDLSVIS